MFWNSSNINNYYNFEIQAKQMNSICFGYDNYHFLKLIAAHVFFLGYTFLINNINISASQLYYYWTLDLRARNYASSMVVNH